MEKGSDMTTVSEWKEGVKQETNEGMVTDERREGDDQKD